MSTKLNLNYDDVTTLNGGDKFPVTVGPILRRTGWRAGIWVRYVPDEFSAAEFTVEKSNGYQAVGFLIYPSENYSNPRESTYRNFTSFQNNISPVTATGGSNVTTMLSGGTRTLFRNYETLSYNPATNKRDLPLTYTLNESMYISENGILCNDDTANLTLALGNNEPIWIGFCSRVPTDEDPRLGVDIKF